MRTSRMPWAQTRRVSLLVPRNPSSSCGLRTTPHSPFKKWALKTLPRPGAVLALSRWPKFRPIILCLPQLSLQKSRRSFSLSLQAACISLCGPTSRRRRTSSLCTAAWWWRWSGSPTTAGGWSGKEASLRLCFSAPKAARCLLQVLLA